MPIGFSAFTAVSALGQANAVHGDALKSGRSGLRACDIDHVDFECFIGRVDGIEEISFPPGAEVWDNRAARLALTGLNCDQFSDHVLDARDRYGSNRIGVILGTSTSGVEAAERAYRARRDRKAALSPQYSLEHNNDHQAVTSFVQNHFALEGPAYTISTACSSSAKAIIDGVELIEAGLCDAVLVGGVDSLCLTSLYGFEALELVSRAPCRPCDKDRDGLSIGEAAAFLLLERSPAPRLRLSGFGESSDGIHMSTPPADGAGAQSAMHLALKRADLSAQDIDFVKLHGTATPANDQSEGTAVAALFGTDMYAASFKGAVGHTLGAAGALEVVLSLLALDLGILPGNVGLQTKDPSIPCTVSATPTDANISSVMANAFGFGGNNCSLVLSKT